MQRILILEDHDDLRTIYADVLGSQYRIDYVTSLADFKAYLANDEARDPHLFLADLSLPDGTLLDMIGRDEWFQRFSGWPTIVISVSDDVTTLERCYGAGVADYLTKPFNPNELLVKCRRVLDRFATRPFAFSSVTMVVTQNSRASDRLTAQESKIFHFLSDAWGVGVSKRRLMEAVWSEDRPSKKLDVHVSRLRKKLLAVGLLIDFRPPDRLMLRAESEPAELV